MKFKQVFENSGWKCDVHKITKYFDVHNPPFRLDDYDLLCVGSPIVQGLPLKELFDDHLGILMPSNLFRGRPPRPNEWDPITEPRWLKKGIVFATYGGVRRGPPEALPALTFLEYRLEDMRVKCIGKFCCPGGNKRGHGLVLDDLAEKKHWTIEDAAAIVHRYQDNPDNPEYAALSEEDRKLVAAAAAAYRPNEDASTGGVFKTRGWHWDLHNRPSERDLLKAQIFLEEILEDYYGGGVEAAPLAQYLCIS